MRTTQQLALALGLAALTACGGGGPGPESPSAPLARIAGVFDPSGEPLEARQWHLGARGVEVPAYGQTLDPQTGIANTGQHVAVAVVDGTVQISHPELQGRLLSTHDVVDGDEAVAAWDAAPDAWRGTAVAGTIAAAARGASEGGSGEGGRGVAPLADLHWFRVLSTQARSPGQRLADALSASVAASARVINQSWAHPEGLALTALDRPWDVAMAELAQRPNAPVWVAAAGDGGAAADGEALPLAGSMSSWDSYASAPQVIAVGVTDAAGSAWASSEPGVNVLLAAPGAAVVTTDALGAAGVAPGDYTMDDSQGLFNGSAAAAAVTSGVVALMLQAKPTLSARDVAWILADTAAAVDCPAHVCAGWLAPAPSAMASEAYSPKYGFGRVNARQAVAAARDFSPLPPQRTCTSGRRYPVQQTYSGLKIPNGTGLSVTASYAGFISAGCAIERIERVELWLEVDASSMTAYDRVRIAGDLNIALSSPSGAVSWFSRAHACRVGAQVDCGDMTGSHLDPEGRRHHGYRFSSVRHMGETLSDGAWTLEVQDLLTSTAGTLNSWELVLHGH